jgi:hypothetical protein
MSDLTIVTGHYGSGKTEFCVNYAITLARTGKSVVLADLDVVNPYFRSREQFELLDSYGVRLVGGSLGLGNLSADMPALPAELYGLIDNRRDEVIFDVGGDANGARVLSRYSGQIAMREYRMFVVVNANRPLTATPRTALAYARGIESQSRLHITGIVNNTHMLRETSAGDIQRGYELCVKLSELMGVPIVFNVVPNMLNTVEIDDRINKLLWIELYMRPTWL